MSLQRYLDQLTDKKSSGAVAITVRMALSDRSAYFYGQIFNHPVVQATLGPNASPEPSADQKTIFAVLRILTYGVWNDLAKESEAVRKFVNDDTLLRAKLRQLSILSVAETNKNIPYATLAAELGLLTESSTSSSGGGSGDASKLSADSAAASASSTASTKWRELEDIVIDSTTAGLITVTLNPQKRVVQVHDAAARDVNISEVPVLLELFRSWSARCSNVVAELERAQEKVRSFEDGQDEHMVCMIITEDVARKKALRAMVEAGAKAGALQ